MFHVFSCIVWPAVGLEAPPDPVGPLGGAFRGGGFG